MMQVGKLIVITGPSGVGKGTLVKLLLERHPELYLSISTTTRSPRPGEIEGKDYYFVSRQDFENNIQDNQFLEWAEYAGNYYGTPRTPVEENIQKGTSVLLEIEVLGARKVKQTFPNVLRLFILPPSLHELDKRLRGRGNDSEASMIRRLQQAKLEIAACYEFDEQIVNDDLEASLITIEKAIFR